jgi:DNA invertase Pin-like site-specific DNA recombinase
MTVIGYVRTCYFDSDAGLQEAALRVWGAEVIRRERPDRTRREGREELREIVRRVEPGDVLLVTRIDRLARSITELCNIMRVLRARGARLVVTEQPLVGEAFFTQVVELFADFEGGLRRERLLEGVAGAKREGSMMMRSRRSSITLMTSARGARGASEGRWPAAVRLGLEGMSDACDTSLLFKRTRACACARANA